MFRFALEKGMRDGASNRLEKQFLNLFDHMPFSKKILTVKPVYT